MKFADKGIPLTDAGMDQVCTNLGIAEPEVWAVLAVETRGFGFLEDRRPAILFERHIFHKLTAGRHDAGNLDISNARPGGYVGGAGEYIRMNKAISLDQQAALESASWGIGQVMGFNFKVAGFTSVDAMVTEMVKDETAQLLAMASFINAKNLAGALRRQNWVSFARGYNGAGFQQTYPARLAAAHAKYKTMLPDLPLRTAQAALLYLGINPGTIDGVNGKRTRSALLEYQQRSGLPATGDLDQDTETRLLGEAF